MPLEATDLTKGFLAYLKDRLVVDVLKIIISSCLTGTVKKIRRRQLLLITDDHDLLHS